MTGDRVLRVVATDGRGRPLAADAVGPWLERCAPRAARGDVAVALVGDRKMRALNQRYRGIDRATDVLAFPAAPAGGRAPRGAPRGLGHIGIATGGARRQARDAGEPLETELRRLALHGLLHLLGYDHTRDDGEMVRFERRLRKKGGIA
ncbi:MAG: rRNA maturation RNase YbeY [Acidobacteria bacterium]|nr:rRNA maturation RNase YbeY [Acidobacteriota bacterium]